MWKNVVKFSNYKLVNALKYVKTYWVRKGNLRNTPSDVMFKILILKLIILKEKYFNVGPNYTLNIIYYYLFIFTYSYFIFCLFYLFLIYTGDKLTVLLSY